jgi:hypothetical protein
MGPMGFTKTWNIREALSIFNHRDIIRKLSQYFNIPKSPIKIAFGDQKPFYKKVSEVSHFQKFFIKRFFAYPLNPAIAA